MLLKSRVRSPRDRVAARPHADDEHDPGPGRLSLKRRAGGSVVDRSSLGPQVAGGRGSLQGLVRHRVS